MRRFRTIALFLLIPFFFSACIFSGDGNTTDIGSDIQSVIVNQVFTDEDGDEAVVVHLNALNSYIADSRSILPDKPKLYFSATGSSYYVDSNGNGVFDSHELADCSSTAALSGASIIRPCYGNIYNSISKLKVTLKINTLYYFTVYGTEVKPSEIPLYGSHVNDTAYTVYTNGEKSLVGLPSSASDYETYCRFRERITEWMKDNAVVMGTACFYIGTNPSGAVSIRRNGPGGDVVSSITVPTTTIGTEGLGHGVFVFDIPGTYRTEIGSTPEEIAAKRLTDKNNSLYWLNVSWTPKDIGVAGSFKFNISTFQSTGQIVEFIPYIATGNYDVDISFLNEEMEDVFVFHDSISVWKNQYSKPVGGSYFYSVRNYNLGNSDFTNYLSYKPREGGKDLAKTDGGVQVMDLDTFGSPYSSGATSSKAYAFTAEDVVDFQRNVFYVSGTGGSLNAAALGTADGSLFKPYGSVQDALDAIAMRRSNNHVDGLEDWNIVLDGSETLVHDVQFTNTSNKNLNITIRSFNPEHKAKLSGKIDIVNANENSIFNLYLTNVDWKPAYTSYTATFGTDVYLLNSTLACLDGAVGPGSGTVVLSSKIMGVTEAGCLYMNASDDESCVMNIVVEDVGHKVLSYQYHDVNSSTISNTDFLEVTGITDRFILRPVVVDKVLKLDDELGDTYGCLITVAK